MKQQYLPALRYNWLTRFYDPLVKITTRELEFKKMLISQAEIKNKQNILDLACGTGTLSIGIKKQFPETNIYAVDADEEILSIAREKFGRFNTNINLVRCFSEQLPFPNESFHVAFSTLSFHHLTLENKQKTIREISRILKNKGKFHIADYGFPINKTQKIFSNIIRLIDGDETTADNLKGCLGKLLEENGFSNVDRRGHFSTILGTIRLFRACKT